MPASRQLCRGKMTSMVRRMIGLDLSVIDPGRGALLFDLVALWPLTRICRRTGVNPWVSGLVFVPVIGLLLVVGVVALARWPLIPPLKRRPRKQRREVAS